MPVTSVDAPAKVERRYVFRAFAFPRHSHWVAACVDLNIFVQADSREEVQRKLLDAVKLYLETVFEKGWERELVPRLAPLQYRLLWRVGHAASRAVRAAETLRGLRDRLDFFTLTGNLPNQLTIA